MERNIHIIPSTMIIIPKLRKNDCNPPSNNNDAKLNNNPVIKNVIIYCKIIL